MITGGENALKRLLSLVLLVEFRYPHGDLFPRLSPQLVCLRYSPLDTFILGRLVHCPEEVQEELRRFVAAPLVL